jgi:hypothetical protein
LKTSTRLPFPQAEAAKGSPFQPLQQDIVVEFASSLHSSRASSISAPMALSWPIILKRFVPSGAGKNLLFR